MTTLSDLVGKKVQTESGVYMGRAHEVRARGDNVVAIIYGTSGFWQRLFPTRRGRRISWERVRRITSSAIVCDD
jgi:sporulation protein YlmC with PRC-barrel domain